jgi:hypothetical protein
MRFMGASSLSRIRQPLTWKADMMKSALQSFFVFALLISIFVPTKSYSQTAQDCSSLSDKDKAYVALADEFLLPTDVNYNTPSWRVNQVTPGIHWRENKIAQDELVSHRVGWTDGHIKFTAFGPWAGIDWIAYRIAPGASPVTERFKCSGYDLTPIEGPENATAYRGHKDNKKDFFLIDDGNVEAVCVMSGPYGYATDWLQKQKLTDPHAGEWCQFD